MSMETTSLRTELVRRLTDAAASLVGSAQEQGLSKRAFIRSNAKAVAVLASIDIVMNAITSDDVEQFLAVQKIISGLHAVYSDNDTNDFNFGSRSGYALAVRYMDMVLKISQRNYAA